ncbi:protein adenylyltransferase SelO family protein [Corynebacterium lubricantis]|uniref:protein adenylyltransferase SelO family protein n=1 Tax=Corynebacterium lubricantis TaxID=541095 RepID=UPI0003628975|nr:protein adenylyltransferase SelO family protein [Corynebacterium lubricantis]
MSEPRLTHAFADALPEFAVETTAASFPDRTLIVLNDDLSRELGLDTDWLRTPEGLAWLTGAGGGHATAYVGHQFGQFAGLLGDGRALLLGDLAGYEIQVKGSGRTAFSRGMSDGKGALGPMLREYLVSEFMHAAGIPTTRALAVVATGERLIRDGRPAQGAVVVRVASSHLRVGTVQLAATQSEELVRRVVEFAGFATASELLDTVINRQLNLVAQWMRIGFVHGVMNTDNVTLSGETIDYGPCAFTEDFDPKAVFSSIDTGGRYAFGNQPDIMAWNLTKLAEALVPVLDIDEAQAMLATMQQRWDELDTSRRDDLVFKPRNRMLGNAIKDAERGDLGPYFLLLGAVTDPYNPKAGPAWLAQPEDPEPFVTYCGT